MICISQIIMLYTLNLYSAVYQLYLSIIGRDKSQIVDKNVCGIESESVSHSVMPDSLWPHGV